MEEVEEAKFHHKRESKCLHQEHKRLLQIPQQMEVEVSKQQLESPLTPQQTEETLLKQARFDLINVG